MTTYYMDSSALIKRYLKEMGTTWVTNIVAPSTRNAIVICDLTPVEVVSTFARRQREGSLTATQVTMLEARYLAHHKREYLSVPLNTDVLARARPLLKQHQLRAFDAIHLASALEAARAFATSPVFVTADKNLLAAATAEGLTTDNPLNHP